MSVYAGDKADYFLRAFRSTVNKQTLVPSEVVVVEDGPVSLDMCAVIERVASESPAPVKRLKLEKNVGLANALAIGLESCSYDIVARMDADDISEPQRFATQLPVIESGFDLVGTALVEFVGHEQHTAITRTPPTDPRDIARSSRFAQPFYHPTVMFRKAAVEAAGGYEDIGPMEDYWLFARMIYGGARVTNIATPLLRYRIDDGAYARRGGADKLRTELGLQWRFVRLGFTNIFQFARNVLIRGGYRLVPEPIRRRAYRRLIATRFSEQDSGPSL